MYTLSASVAGSAATVLVAGLVASAPASAGLDWGEPQEIDNEYGVQVRLSDDGRMAAWINVAGWDKSGPVPVPVLGEVRTARFITRKDRWSAPRPVGGSAGADQVELSGDGRTLLIKGPGNYSVATRAGSGNRWTAPETLVESTARFFGHDLLAGGRISADGRTAMWADAAAHFDEPGQVKRIVLRSRVRAPDGSWRSAQEVGDLPGLATSSGEAAFGAQGGLRSIALSGDGATAVWLAVSGRLVGADRAADGTWGEPSKILPIDMEPEFNHVQLSADGGRVLWESRAVIVSTARRTATGWSPPTSLVREQRGADQQSSSVSMSPNGRVVAYGPYGRSGELRVRRYTSSGTWTRPLTLGPSESGRKPGSAAVYDGGRIQGIVARNRAVAWVVRAYHPSALRVSLLRKGTWRPATKVAPKALSPALSRKGDTLVWAGKKAGGIFSVKR